MDENILPAHAGDGKPTAPEGQPLSIHRGDPTLADLPFADIEFGPRAPAPASADAPPPGDEGADEGGPALHPLGSAVRLPEAIPPPAISLADKCAGWAAQFAANPKARGLVGARVGLPDEVYAHFPDLGVRTDHPSGRCWCLPERDGRRTIVGASLHFTGSNAETTTEGTPGLLLPTRPLRADGPLYVTFGAENVLAMVAAGLDCVGLSESEGGDKHLVEFVRADFTAGRHIIIVARRESLAAGVRKRSVAARASAVANALAALGHTVEIGSASSRPNSDIADWFRDLIGDCQWSELGKRFPGCLALQAVKPTCTRAVILSPPAGAESSEAAGPAAASVAEGPESDAPPLGMSEAHLGKCRESGLTDVTIRNARLSTETDADRISGWLGWEGKDGACRAHAVLPCLAFPHFDWSGKYLYARIRPDRPRQGDKPGKVRKYEQPVGVQTELYIPPPLVKEKLHDDAARPLIITEGELKALCATQHGFACVSIPGVDCWARKASNGERELTPLLAQMKLDGRAVTIIYDSDVATKPQVKRSAYTFQKALLAKKASVKFLILPAKSDGAKMGLDDFLVDPEHGPDALRDLIATARPAPRPANGELRNFEEIEIPPTKEGGSPKIENVPRSAKDVLADVLERTGGEYPVAVGNALYAVVGGKLRRLPDATALFALLTKVFERGSAPGVRWAGHGPGFVSRDVFFDYVRGEVRQYDTTSDYPHHPPIPAVLYAPFQLAGGDGAAFRKLASFFCLASATDEAVFRAALATPFWGGPPGRRPAFFFCPDKEAAKAGRQTGKSTAADMITRLYGGCYDLNMHEDWKDFKKRLVNSSTGKAKRIVLLDNVKTKNLSWSDFERFITAPTVNGDQHYAGDRDVPNFYTPFVTINGATLSTDMASRGVPVHFRTPAYSPTWQATVENFIDANRAAIFGDIAALLGGAAGEVRSPGRFPAWEAEVLSRFAGAATNDVIDAIRDWQDAADGDREGADHLRDAVAKVLELLGGPFAEPDAARSAVLIWTADAVHQLMLRATGKRTLSKSEASSALASSGVAEFRKDRDKTKRFWLWRGPDAAPDAPPTHAIEHDGTRWEAWTAIPVKLKPAARR